MQSPKMAKKLVIRNFKGTINGQRLPDDFEASSWAKICVGLHAIFDGRAESVSLETLYRTCEDMCRCRMAQPLYSRLYSECEKHVQKYLTLIRERVSANMGHVSLLESFCEVWEEYTAQVRLLCSVFLYLDRVFVLARPELASIWDLCMTLFRGEMTSFVPVKAALIPALLNTVDDDRRDGTADMSGLLGSVFEMLASLKLTEEWVRGEMGESGSLFFAREAEERLALLSIPHYLEYVRRRIDGETLRYERYRLDPRHSGDLARRVQDALFTSRLEEILGKGLAGMVLAQDTESLAVLYGLAQDTDRMNILREYWLSFVKSTGSALVNDASKDEMLVGELIEFKGKLDEIVKTSFVGNSMFTEAVKEAFEAFMNNRQNRPVELLAKYADFQLRVGGTENMTEAELEDTLDKIIVIFRFVQGKDVFESFYKRDLSRRLLLSRSLSIDAEKSLVGRLKQECGSAFTSRLEGMFKDIELSREIMAVYNQRPVPGKARGERGEKSDFNAWIVTSGLWPYPPLVNVGVPPFVAKKQDMFSEFYQSQHKGRVLTWHQGLGHCVVRAHFPLGSKELQVSIPQAIVILQFNDHDELTYAELREGTLLDDANLTRTLQSLACGKVNILNKSPKGREVSTSDSFSYNGDFASKHHRIRINALAQREVREEAGLLLGEGSNDRQHQIDAAIVRILKSHKRLESSELLDLVSAELKCSLSLADFNKRVSSLVEREFLAPDTKDYNFYIYMA